jgi:hypothetical protein
MVNQIIYKPKIDVFILNLLYVAVLAFFIGLLKSFEFDKALIFVGVILSFSILFIVLKKRLTQLTLNYTSNELVLILKQLYITSTITIRLHELKFSFRKETGARGLKQKQLKIYKDDKLIISLTPSIFGWDEKCIYNMLEDIKELKPNLFIED